MKCFTCKEEMKCYDDINDISVRIDFVKCPKCNSMAEIIYHPINGYILKVDWER